MVLDKLEKFYLKLPEDILKSSEEAEYNRETRRQLKKYKTIETKINYILKDEARHKMFINYIYNMYDNNINYDSVEKVIDSINKNNFIQSMLYMLKNFYSDNKFEEYVLSNNYDQILMDLNDKSDDIKESINKYLVNIEFKSGYHNIYPLFNIKQEKLIEVKEEEYPDYGNINVNPWSEFEKENYDIKSPLWICEISKSELEDNPSKTKFKIDGNKLIKNNAIYSISNEEMYEVVELIENDDIDKLIYNEKIEIKREPILKSSDKIYIKDNRYIYGPFRYEENKQGGGYYIDKKNIDYIIEKYPIEDNESHLSIHEIKYSYGYNNSFVTIVHFCNKKQLISETMDVISNKELINKVKEIINTKNLQCSEKQIEEIRKNINIIIDNSLSDERIKRLKRLIRNTENTDKFIETDLIEIIGLLLDKQDTRESILNKILGKHEIFNDLQNIQCVQAKINSKNENLNIEKDNLINSHSEISRKTKVNLNEHYEAEFLNDFKKYTIKEKLCYKKEDLINFHISIKTNPLTILAGQSGTGKTQLALAYADMLGLNEEDKTLLIVPINPSYTEPGDILGYLNTTNGLFIPSETGLTDFLVNAKNNLNKMHMVIFDEMNLSQVEYWFAPFISLLELRPEQRKLRLYSNAICHNSEKYPDTIKIGENVIFIGTVNLDETTKGFSDRLLDRANIVVPKKQTFIDLKKEQEYINNKPEEQKILSFYSQKDYFSWINNKKSALEAYNDNELKFLDKLHNLIQKYDNQKGVSFRIFDKIGNYINNIPLDENGELSISRKNAFDIQIKQRLLTKIKGTEQQYEKLIGTAENESELPKDSELYEFFNDEEAQKISDFNETKKDILRKAKELSNYGYTN